MNPNCRFLLFAAPALAVSWVTLAGCSAKEGPGLAGRGPADVHHPVSVRIARRSASPSELILPANLQPHADTPIYARASGYVEKWLADIGDRVKAGQTLAIIASPELDQQLNQSRARLDQARARLELARLTSSRWNQLGSRSAVPQQDIDEKTADLRAKEADVNAAQASVERLVQLQRFDTIVAPFDGVISARSIDVGTFVTAGGSRELFHLTQSDLLRAIVGVPQSHVRDVRNGLPVEVRVDEFPGEVFRGHVVRNAGVLDASSRSLRIEVQIPNPNSRLFAGMYCRLYLHLTPFSPLIVIPSTDAIIRGDGTWVAVVTPKNTIHLQKVSLGRDFGTQIEIVGGLEDGARVVDNPNDALAEGMVVEPVAIVPPKKG